MRNSSEIKHIRELYESCYSRFLRFAKSYIPNNEIAEDVVLESLMYYWEHRSVVVNETQAPSYILTVIKHKCLNHLRQLQTQRRAEEYLNQLDQWELNLKISTLNACNPERLFSEEVKIIINRTLTSFPMQTREIFIRSRFLEQSHKRIALDMGLSTKSIEYHITKSLKVLRMALKDYFPILYILLVQLFK